MQIRVPIGAEGDNPYFLPKDAEYAEKLWGWWFIVEDFFEVTEIPQFAGSFFYSLALHGFALTLLFHK